MKRQQRLRRPIDFRRVREGDRRGTAHPLLVLYVAPNELAITRVGITVSGRVGNAVVRNRVRRRLRELVTARLADLPPHSDVVISARPGSATASFAELATALQSVIDRATRARV